MGGGAKEVPGDAMATNAAARKKNLRTISVTAFDSSGASLIFLTQEPALRLLRTQQRTDLSESDFGSLQVHLMRMEIL